MTREEIEKFTASPDIELVDAMRKIDKNSYGVLYIIDEAEKLIGCLSDGDIRRYIIRTGTVSGKAQEIMNKTPKFVCESEGYKAKQYIKKYIIRSLPVVSQNGQIVDIIFRSNNHSFDEKITDRLKGTPTIIMAGGKGTRLYPYTKILPKPLIPIGDVPILERILNRFTAYGIDEFYITVNYKKEMIKSYFLELAPEYQIHFIEEEKPLGTAGSITLIDKEFDRPVIVTNCDILIEAEYDKVLDFHEKSGNDITIVSSLKNTEIPYGVLHSEKEGIVSSMEEKPTISYLINTGMYIVNPDALTKIPKDTFYHMPSLAESIMKEGGKVGTYPISENSFLDMGQFAEMKRMEERIESGELN